MVWEFWIIMTKPWQWFIYSNDRIDSLEKFRERIPFLRSELKDERMFNGSWCLLLLEFIIWYHFLCVFSGEVLPKLMFLKVMSKIFLWLSFSDSEINNCAFVAEMIFASCHCPEKFFEIYNFAFGWAKEKVLFSPYKGFQLTNEYISLLPQMRTVFVCQFLQHTVALGLLILPILNTSFKIKTLTLVQLF